MHRVVTRHQPDEPSGEPHRRPPDRPVGGTRRDAVEPAFDPRVRRRIARLARLDVLVAATVAVRVEHLDRPALCQLLVAGLVVHLRIEPGHDRSAAGKPQLVVPVEVQVVRPIAGVDRGDLLRFRVPQLHLPVAALDREDPCSRMARPRPAEGLGLGRTYPGCNPHAGPAVHGKAVRIALAVPDDFVTPVRGWHERQRRGRGRRVRVAHLQVDRGRGTRRRMQQRHVVGAVLRGSVHRTVGVDLRVSLVGRDQVVQVRTRIGPVPQADDDVALDAGWSGRLSSRILARRDAIGPIGVHRKRGSAPDLVQPPVHVDPGLARRSQASTCESKSPRAAGISRVAWFPIAWHPMHPSVLMTPRIQAP